MKFLDQVCKIFGAKNICAAKNALKSTHFAGRKSHLFGYGKLLNKWVVYMPVRQIQKTKRSKGRNTEYDILPDAGHPALDTRNPDHFYSISHVYVLELDLILLEPAL